MRRARIGKVVVTIQVFLTMLLSSLIVSQQFALAFKGMNRTRLYGCIEAAEAAPYGNETYHVD